VSGRSDLGYLRPTSERAEVLLHHLLDSAGSKSPTIASVALLARSTALKNRRTSPSFAA